MKLTKNNMEKYSNCCGADMTIYDDQGVGRCPECEEMCSVIIDEE